MPENAKLIKTLTMPLTQKYSYWFCLDFVDVFFGGTEKRGYSSLTPKVIEHKGLESGWWKES